MADVREALLRTVLGDIAAQLHYTNSNLHLNPLPPTGANFTSQLFQSVISAPGQEDLNLFAKVAVVGETLRAQAPTKIFDIERYVYTKLAKTYADIEDKHQVPAKYRLFVPKLYGCNDTYLEEVIVLQDLSKEGFTTYNRLKSIDWEYASKAVEELAKLHALSIAYQKEYPEEFKEASKVLKREILDDPSMMGVIQQMMEKVLQSVREENRGKLMQFLMQAFSKPDAFMDYYTPKRRPVIIHSDFRQSNLMHRIQEDGSVEVVIVDYQTMHPGCAANDLLYFIFTGSDGQFRQEHYERLIDHYYQHMAAALRRLDLDSEEVFPREDFDQELKEMLPFGLVISGMMLPMVTLDAAQVPASGGSDSMEAMLGMLAKTNELCGTRLNEIVDDYVAWGVL